MIRPHIAAIRQDQVPMAHISALLVLVHGHVLKGDGDAIGHHVQSLIVGKVILFQHLLGFCATFLGPCRDQIDNDTQLLTEFVECLHAFEGAFFPVYQSIINVENDTTTQTTQGLVFQPKLEPFCPARNLFGIRVAFHVAAHKGEIQWVEIVIQVVHLFVERSSYFYSREILFDRNDFLVFRECGMRLLTVSSPNLMFGCMKAKDETGKDATLLLYENSRNAYVCCVPFVGDVLECIHYHASVYIPVRKLLMEHIVLRLLPVPRDVLQYYFPISQTLVHGKA